VLPIAVSALLCLNVVNLTQFAKAELPIVATVIALASTSVMDAQPSKEFAGIDVKLSLSEARTILPTAKQPPALSS
jgi:hypothetical protein